MRTSIDSGTANFTNVVNGTLLLSVSKTICARPDRDPSGGARSRRRMAGHGGLNKLYRKL